jgi:hypothetical protein
VHQRVNVFGHLSTEGTQVGIREVVGSRLAAGPNVGRYSGVIAGRIESTALCHALSRGSSARLTPPVRCRGKHPELAGVAVESPDPYVADRCAIDPCHGDLAGRMSPATASAIRTPVWESICPSCRAGDLRWRRVGPKGRKCRHPRVAH